MSLVYNQFAKTFSKSRRNMKWKEIENFMKDIEKLNISGLSILDVGCGSGRILDHMGEVEDFHYLGIDSSFKMIDEAKTEHPGMHFKVHDMKEIDKLDKKFDIVFFIASFHHLEDIPSRRDVLEKLKRILKEGGRAYMTNWHLLGEKNLKKYEKSHRGNGDFSIKIGSYSRYYHSFSLDELEELFTKTGFEIIENRISETGNNLISIITKK